MPFSARGRAIAGAVAVFISACTTEETTNSTPAESCRATPLPAQPLGRFPTGETYLLPRLEGDCASGWRLETAPLGQTNLVVSGEDGHRFTPVVVGRHRFVQDESGATVELEAVDALEAPFHNFSYYPTRSVARVGDELWVANAVTPTLGRLAPTGLSSLGELLVGPWPVAVAWQAGMRHALVAQQAGDTLGLVDLGTRTLVDAIWVGDEPTNVLVAPDGKTAYVSLASEGAVAVVDLDARRVVRKIAAVADPHAMALSSDGATLFVASRRSGHAERNPAPPEAAEAQLDIARIRTADGVVEARFLDVGETLTGLLLSEDDASLYVSGTRNATLRPINDPTEPSFVSFVARLDAGSGAEQAMADLSRQDSAAAEAVSPQGMAWLGDRLWVAIESNDLVLALDPATLEERARVPAAGRPRAVLAGTDRLFVHGGQGFVVTTIGADGRVLGQASTGTDPRPAELALGQRIFTGAGDTFGTNWSCNACHADGLGDTLVWNAGPFVSRKATRPLYWLEGTQPLGWDAYVSSPRNFAYAGSGTVGLRPTTETGEAVARYLESLMPPPPANTWTTRDGRLSEAGEAGRAIFEGKGACVACHPLPLTTTKAQLDPGLTEGYSDIPALIGAYRNGAWLKQGEAVTLQASVERALEYLGKSLSDEEVASLTRFLMELTGRELFALTTEPSAGARAAAVDADVSVRFSLPIHDEADNLARVRLLSADGAELPVDRSLEGGRQLRLRPRAALAHGSRYVLVIDASLEGRREERPARETRVEFTTAAAPELRLPARLDFTVQTPFPDFANGRFDPSRSVPSTITVTATPTASGADLAFDYGRGLVFAVPAVIDGRRLIVPPVIIGAGQSFADGFSGLETTLSDADGDGVADEASGVLEMTGPGFRVPGVAWSLAAKVTVAGCEAPEMTGMEITRDADGHPSIGLRDANTRILGLYVTEPGAQLPAGPGSVVSGGAAYWALAATMFPAGFPGPVRYGEVPSGARDDSTTHGAPAGGATLEAGRCYQVGVVTSQFRTEISRFRY
jgi:hypothetical protein